MNKNYDSIKAREAQEEYCEKTDTPHFAPMSGTCWKCKRNIYERYFWKYENGRSISVKEDDATNSTGITVEEASKHLVTGCPHCNRSYVD